VSQQQATPSRPAADIDKLQANEIIALPTNRTFENRTGLTLEQINVIRDTHEHGGVNASTAFGKISDDAISRVRTIAPQELTRDPNFVSRKASAIFRRTHLDAFPKRALEYPLGRPSHVNPKATNRDSSGPLMTSGLLR
jgi:hypothetical protein